MLYSLDLLSWQYNVICQCQYNVSDAIIGANSSVETALLFSQCCFCNERIFYYNRLWLVLTVYVYHHHEFHEYLINTYIYQLF